MEAAVLPGENKDRIDVSQVRYRQENRAKEAARQRRYYQENKEQILAQKGRYHQANRDKRAAYQRRYYQENKEKIIARQLRYYYEQQEPRRDSTAVSFSSKFPPPIPNPEEIPSKNGPAPV